MKLQLTLLLLAITCQVISGAPASSGVEDGLTTLSWEEAAAINGELCLEHAGYPCEEDTDCDGLSRNSCDLSCDTLMKVCYLSEMHDALNLS